MKETVKFGNVGQNITVDDNIYELDAEGNMVLSVSSHFEDVSEIQSKATPGISKVGHHVNCDEFFKFDTLNKLVRAGAAISKVGMEKQSLLRKLKVPQNFIAEDSKNLSSVAASGVVKLSSNTSSICKQDEEDHFNSFVDSVNKTQNAIRDLVKVFSKVSKEGTSEAGLELANPIKESSRTKNSHSNYESIADLIRNSISLKTFISPENILITVLEATTALHEIFAIRGMFCSAGITASVGLVISAKTHILQLQQRCRDVFNEEKRNHHLAADSRVKAMHWESPYDKLRIKLLISQGHLFHKLLVFFIAIKMT